MKINEITRAGLCSGCGLCQTVFGDKKLSIELSASGFLRPNLKEPLSHSETHLLNSFCPGINLQHAEPFDKYDPHWGPVHQCFVGRAVDDFVCHRGSSGGVISALAIFLLESGAVEGIIQTTALKSAPLDNVTLISRSRADVLAASGSRYAPSAPLAKLDQVLEQQGPFAFIGKPCDVAGLRALSRIDKRVNRKISYMLAFFCAGVPSQNGTYNILKRFGLKPDEVAKFRYRGEGWPGKTLIQTKDGREYSMTYAESWGAILNRELQFRCKICPDGTGEFADIVCADAWHGDKQEYPVFNEAEGRSLILARTKTGVDLLETAIQSSAVTAEPYSASGIGQMQPYQFKRKSLILSRLLALRLVGRTVPRYQKLCLVKAAFGVGVIGHLRSFVGMLHRALIRAAARKKYPKKARSKR